MDSRLVGMYFQRVNSLAELLRSIPDEYAPPAPYDIASLVSTTQDLMLCVDETTVARVFTSESAWPSARDVALLIARRLRDVASMLTEPETEFRYFEETTKLGMLEDCLFSKDLGNMLAKTPNPPNAPIGFYAAINTRLITLAKVLVDMITIQSDAESALEQLHHIQPLRLTQLAH